MILIFLVIGFVIWFETHISALNAKIFDMQLKLALLEKKKPRQNRRQKLARVLQFPDNKETV